MTYTRMIVIAPIEKLPELRQYVTDSIDTVGGQNWFVEALSADGTAPATYGWASFQATEDEARYWQETYGEDPDIGIYTDTQPQEVLLQEGLQLVRISEE